MHTTQQKLKVVIVDDHFLFPLALEAVIKKYSFLETVAILANGRELIDQLEQLKPDIVFMDIVMPVMDGFHATRLVMDINPDIKVITITAFDEGENVKRMMEAGAWGYIIKDSNQKEYEDLFDQIVDGKKFISPKAAVNYALYMNGDGKKTISELKAPEVTVTKRELEIIEHIARGLSDKEIAKELSVSHRTIDAHKQNMMQKFGTRKAAEIVSIAYRLKLI